MIKQNKVVKKGTIFHPRHHLSTLSINPLKSHLEKETISSKRPVKYKERNYFESITKQRTFMEQLYRKFHLTQLDDWLFISREKISQNGGQRLLIKHYKKDIKLLLSTVYPNYPWDFNFLKFKIKFHSIEDQRKRMEQIFDKLKLKSLEEFIYISQQNIIQKGGQSLIKHYNNEMEVLLSTIFPNFPWQFEIKNRNYFKSIENQQNFMYKLFIKFKLKTIDEWNNISRSKVIRNGGSSLIVKYNHNMKDLLSSIYPNFPWNFTSLKFRMKFHSIEDQRKRMDQIFDKLQLKSPDDWVNISREIIVQKGGGKLLYDIFNGDFIKLLTTIYPNFPFDFPIQMKISKNEFNSIEEQQNFIEYLFYHLKLKSFDDWIKISPKKLKRNGGEKLIKRDYNNDMKTLLSSLYPNYPWCFIRSKYHSIEEQRKRMDQIFIKLKLKSFDDWINVKKRKIDQKRRILIFYNNNLHQLLRAVYPNFPWCFPKVDFRIKLLPKVKELIDKYHITQKKDWYRLPSDSNAKFDLVNTLKLFYPSEKWKKSNFISRTKKITQRLLFSFTRMIYPSLLIFENYFHPKLMNKTINFELDIFIPALQIAMEYQGQQHYDDLPAAFGAGIELVQSRDRVKERMAKKLTVKIIYIPYWWDLSLSSFQSSLQSQL